MSSLKSRLPAKKTPNLDDFLSGAEKKTTQKKAKNRTTNLPWNGEGVREDITKLYNLRLSEPYFMKLKYIADNTPGSMQKFCLRILEKEIDKKIKELTNQYDME